MSGNNSSPLEGRSVVIIGGGTGIGFAVAEQATGLRANVILGSSTAAKVEAAAGRLSGARGLAVDLRDQTSIAKFFGRIGRFDHLVITAGDWGGSMYVPARHLDIEAARDLFSVRFWGALAAVKCACETISQDGSIVLTSGVVAHHPMKGAPMMTAMSGAVEHLTRGLAVDLSPVRVNAVSPGLVLTEHVTRAMSAEMIQGIVAGLPLPRAAQPAEAARAYVYLMTNSYVTGQVLPVDGGGMLV
jgi:NAD(P)-dependent dehydrogenase (short-subunit alcohol dehydrogenase family)